MFIISKSTKKFKRNDEMMIKSKKTFEISTFSVEDFFLGSFYPKKT